MRRLVLLLGMTALGTTGAEEDGLWYADASTAAKLESRVGLRIDQDVLALAGALTLENRAGDTDVLPRLSSEWYPLDGLDVSTSVRFPDWNGAAGSAAVDTHVRFRPPAAFIDGIRAAARHGSRDDSRRSLEVLFAPVETSLRLLGGDPLALEADAALVSTGRETLSSRVESTWGIGPAIDAGTTLRLEAGAAAPVWASEVVYRAPLPGIEGLEGRIGTAPDGTLEQALAIRFPGVEGTSIAGAPLTLESRAILSEASGLDRDGHRRLGLETQIGGLAPRLLGGRNALSLTLERDFRLDAEQRASLSYGHSWRPHEHGSVGLNLEVLDALDESEPSLDLTWEARF